MERPLETDTNLSILKFDNDLAKQVYWHSSAHILGEACERFCGCYLCYGPPIADGFYYDMYTEVKKMKKVFFYLFCLFYRIIQLHAMICLNLKKFLKQ